MVMDGLPKSNAINSTERLILEQFKAHAVTLNFVRKKSYPYSASRVSL